MGKKVNPSDASDKVKRYREKQDLLLAFLPLFDFKVSDAAIHVGYAASYAKGALLHKLKKDEAWQAQVARLKAVQLSSAADKKAALLARLDWMIDSRNMADVNQLRAIELRAKILGMLKEQVVIDDPGRARELSEEQQAEAKRYALWSLAQRRADACQAG